MPSKKKTTTQKAVKKNAAKKTVKKSAAKEAAPKKSAPIKAADKTNSPAKKPAIQKEAPAEKKTAPLKKTVVSRSGAAADKKSTPIVFSLDDIEELMASKKMNVSPDEEGVELKVKVTPENSKVRPAKKVVVVNQPIEKRVLRAASLADILGFNPAEKKKKTELDDGEISKKWKKYYDLLIKLRSHVSEEINLHTSETLKHSSRDDSGDLSGYGSHQADGGTDSFDRDFALSLVSSEQEALNEIEEAILRIKDGSYGTCEITGKPIPAARLTAVPFARYSVEGQVEHEKNRHRRGQRSASVGIFGDATDAPKLESSDDDDD